MAAYLLTHAPELYTPLPEIFVDRTNGDDADHPVSAIYKTNGTCTKAYILPLDIPKLLSECTLELGSFTFRMVAGLLLSGLFLARGFGIAAWTHALYDVFLTLRGGF